MEAPYLPLPVWQSRHSDDQEKALKISEDALSIWDHYPLLLIEVLKSYEVKNILWTGVKRDTAQYQEWLKLIEEEEAEVVIVSEPMNIYFGGREKQPIFYILRPLGNLEGKEINNINNTSIVARLVFGETSFLFTGDISKSIERSLVSYSSNGKIVIDSDILKVSHHGSKSSTAKEFIEAVSPDAAIIQCGKDNRYGHPHSQVLLNLEGIDILRTDINGDIRITIDDSQYKISTEN